jgi:hypothetical protein
VKNHFAISATAPEATRRTISRTICLGMLDNAKSHLEGNTEPLFCSFLSPSRFSQGCLEE